MSGRHCDDSQLRQNSRAIPWRDMSTLVAGMCLLLASPGSADDPEEAVDEHVHNEAVHSMTGPPGHHEAHMRWTPSRAPTPEDRQRAEQIVQTLRSSLEKYKDHRVAIEDGYDPFLPNIPQPRYHFTNKWVAFKGAFSFDPAKPTSLLYKKTADGYQLIGAMYTAPKRLSEKKLNDRIPLSIARWHAHVNICLPPRRQRGKADWSQFGFRGSITTEEACDKARGRWYPQIFGWMVHVNPFEESPEQIWVHNPDHMQ